MTREEQDRAAVRRVGIKPIRFQPADLPCPGGEDDVCRSKVCAECARFSTAPTLGPVMQPPARRVPGRQVAWTCVDFVDAAHSAECAPDTGAGEPLAQQGARTYSTPMGGAA